MQKTELSPTEQQQQQPKRPHLLDLSFESTPCTSSIVNWLHQTASMSLASDYSPMSGSELSSLTDHSLSSPTSVSSTNTDDESFNYLYLLASAAVERLSSSNNDHQ